MRWRAVNGSPLTLPLRLLELEQTETGTIIRLVTSGERRASTGYLTLSHCWGRNMPLRLTTAFQRAFEEGFPVSRLPPTFRQTACVASYLGLRYLWIDALCIFQDSVEDWAAQAADMGNVYSNSYVNIAASASADSTEGLFRHRETSSLQPLLFRSRNNHLYWSYRDTFHEDLAYNPLNRRAWVVQERFLSPRVVHFSKHQIHWECICSTTSENLPREASKAMGSQWACLKTSKVAQRMLVLALTELSGMADEGIYSLWDRLLAHYTGSDLTFASDKAMAIHALAVVFCRYLRQDPEFAYVNGIWRAQFVSGLLWHQGGKPADEGRHIDSVSCSWSWLSAHGLVSSQYKMGWEDSRTREESARLTNVARLVEVHAECTLSAPVAAPVGIAVVQGPLCAAILKAIPPKVYLFIDQHYSLQVGATVLQHVENMDIRMDNALWNWPPGRDERTVYLLLCRVWPRPDRSERGTTEADEPAYGAGDYECLILEPVDELPGRYRRIGYVDFCRMRVPGPTKEEIGAINLATCRALDAQFRSYDVPKHMYHDVDDKFMYTITLV